MTSEPIRYGSGLIELKVSDLSSNGFGTGWGHQRSYNNVDAATIVGANGARWQVRQMAHLEINSNQIVLVYGAGETIQFQSDGSGGWEPVFNSRAILVHDSGNQEYCLTRGDGTRWVFYDESAGVLLTMRRKLKKMVDRFGHITAGTYNTAGQLLQMKFTSVDGALSSCYDYGYLAAGDNSGLLEYVKLTVNGRPVREAQYHYYVAADDYGSANDLKRVDLGEYDAESESWSLIRQQYYRYYTSGTAPGFVHGLKSVVSPEGYAKMRSVGIDPETAEDEVIKPYTSMIFEYNGSRQVSKETVRGGTEEYGFAYETNSANPTLTDWNVWATQTIETLPDLSTRTVYQNKAGMIILSKLEEAGLTPKQWFTYREFNNDGQATLAAKPSAIDSVTEPTVGSNVLTVTLKAGAGVVYENTFYAATNIGAGEIATYQKELLVKEGAGGAGEKLRTATYATQTVDNAAIHLFASDTVYPETGVPATSTTTRVYYDEDGNPGAIAGFMPPPELANSVVNDVVIEQSEVTYNGASQVVVTAQFQRFHDATGDGALGGPNGAEPKARRSYGAQWYDPIGRSVASADYGTYGGAQLVRPDDVPERSDTVLVSSNRYAKDGESNAVIDPMGVMTRWENDRAGRKKRLIEAAVEGKCGCKGGKHTNDCNDGDRITKFTYNDSGQPATLTLVNNETGNQVTRWVYGTTLTDSGVARNDLLTAKIYPESDDDYAPVGDGVDEVFNRIEYSYNRQGNVVTMKDPNETVHTYGFDELGRTVSDAVTAFGAGIADAVKRIETAYEDRGMPLKVTSFDAVSGGNIVNEVGFAYDDFGHLIDDKQSHSGVVDGSTPKVSYAHENGATGNTARRTGMTYPDGRAIEWAYGATDSIDDVLGRVASLKVTGETENLVAYTHVGAARYVKIAYPEPGIELSYIAGGSEPERDSGDPYTGYDRFGRTVDMKWQANGGGGMKDRIQYGYDRSSNRTWRKNLVAPSGQDEHYSYDELYQVTDFARGNINLNQTAIGGVPALEQTFVYDATGNWERYTTSEDGIETLDQSRKHNQDNQVTQIDGSNTGILYDRAGNALQMPPVEDGDWAKYHRFVWDAWNRLVTIEDENENTVAQYEYDATTRRTLKMVSGTTTHFYYNSQWKCVEERLDSAAKAHQQYLWGTRPNHRAELIRRDRDANSTGPLEEKLYCLMDYFSPTSMTDDSGNVQERYQFSAFGIRQITDASWAVRTSSSFDVEFVFHGEFRDDESGLNNYGYRYFSPMLGRWINRDPIAEGGGLNLYEFVGNNGVGKTDFLGQIKNDVKLMSTVDKNLRDHTSRIGDGLSFLFRFDQLISSLRSVVPKLEFGYHNSENWAWGDLTHNVYTPIEDKGDIGGEDVTDMIHELVHAHLKINYGVWGNSRDGESYAYGTEFIFNALEDAYKIEQALNDATDCNGLKSKARGMWYSLWNSYNEPGKKTAFWTAGGSKKRSALTGRDFENIKSKLFVSLSCEQLSQYLSSKGLANKCCIRFSCEQKPWNDNSVDLHPGSKIDDAFK